MLGLCIELQDELNANLMSALRKWIKQKPVAKEQTAKQISALVINVLGGWLTYLSFVRQSTSTGHLTRNIMLEEWSVFWTSVLDQTDHN